MNQYSPFEYNAFPISSGFVTLTDAKSYGLESIGSLEGRIAICPSKFLEDVIAGNMPLQGRYEFIQRTTHILDLERGNLIQAQKTWFDAQYVPTIFEDGEAIPPRVFNQGVNPLVEALVSNQATQVIVSCAQGVSRSPSIAMAILYKSLLALGEAPSEELLLNCLGVIGHSRPGAMPHLEIWKSIQAHLGVTIDEKHLNMTLAALARNNAGIRSGRIQVPGINC